MEACRHNSCLSIIIIMGKKKGKGKGGKCK
jgi:hypothetical protein